MSLIITYIGNKGCIIAGDKRRIGFFGPEDARKKIEEELYSGKIKTRAELVEKSAEQGVNLKISDDADKISEIGEVIVGEVRSRTTHETKRKRIYAISGAYSMVEILGSEIQTMKSGGSSIVVFGNKFTQELAEKTIKKHWKPKIKLMDVEKILESVMEEVSQKTPSVSKEYDMIMKYSNHDQKSAKKIIRETVLEDIKKLENYRNKLREDIVKTSQNIQMATKIIIEGNIGKVTSIKGNEIEIKLDNGVEALDTQWNSVAKPSQTIKMTAENNKNISIGDSAVIKKENLCIHRTNEGLNCDFILCRSEDK
jgi:hypothetical protein